jgi:carbon monoxide dehydrogenase subunit G
MNFHHTFTVGAPIDEVWEAILDVPRAGPCVPGARILEQEGANEYRAAITVELGGLTVTYTGEVEVVESDAAVRRAVMSARANEALDRSAAYATFEVRLSARDGTTHGTVHTDLAISGRAAAAGQGPLGDAAARIIETFAANLTSLLTGAAPTGDAAGTAEPGPVGPWASRLTTPTPTPTPAPDPWDEPWAEPVTPASEAAAEPAPPEEAPGDAPPPSPWATEPAAEATPPEDAPDDTPPPSPWATEPATEATPPEDAPGDTPPPSPWATEPAEEAAPPEDAPAPLWAEPDALEPEPEPDALEPEPEPDALEPESEPDALEPEPEPDALEPATLEADALEPEPEPAALVGDPGAAPPDAAPPGEGAAAASAGVGSAGAGPSAPSGQRGSLPVPSIARGGVPEQLRNPKVLAMAGTAALVLVLRRRRRRRRR